MRDVAGYSDAKLAAVAERKALDLLRLAERFGSSAALETYGAWNERKAAVAAELSRRTADALNVHAEATGTPVRFYPSRPPRRPFHLERPGRKPTTPAFACRRSRGTTRASRATRRQRVVRSHGPPGREPGDEPEPPLDPPAHELYSHAARAAHPGVARWLQAWGDETAGRS
jgi:hypothetical protein